MFLGKYWEAKGRTVRDTFRIYQFVMLSNRMATYLAPDLIDPCWPQKQGNLFPPAEAFVRCFLSLKRRRERGREREGRREKLKRKWQSKGRRKRRE